MSLLSLLKSSPQSPLQNDAAGAAAGKGAAAPTAVHPLDGVTGGAFSAPTSGERAARVREWLASEPSAEKMAEVFKELSQRDRGAAKPLKEKLDEIKRQKNQALMAEEWAQKAQALLDASRLNLADAMAWQRDAAKAGAPLSREPLLSLRQSLAERVKAVEDLQHRVQVERESAVLMAQRIEVMSTKSWREAQQLAVSLRADVEQWRRSIDALAQDVHWASVEPKFPPMLASSRDQLQLVWDAFEAALAQAVAAETDPLAPLPAVPVWADELRLARGESAPAAAGADAGSEQRQARRMQAAADLERALAVLETELEQGHGKATPKAAADVRAVLKGSARLLTPELEARAHAALKQAGDMEDWQRWRADQLREELVHKAEALVAAPPAQRLGGRKMQETLRSLREQWKTTDQGGAANHALWKRFDHACTEAHKVVEDWLVQIRQQAEASKAQRHALIEALSSWTLEHAQNTDWKAQIKALHGFSEQWREAGHLSEKAFAEMQPVWKAAMSAAHAPLEAAQATSVGRRRQMIEEAVSLGAAVPLNLGAVKALQQRWQAEAHAVPLERKQEQKLWEAFRQPIDEAFARKSAEREAGARALNAHDQRVLDASRAVDAAVAQGDVQAIRLAAAALEQVLRGEIPAHAAPAEAPAVAGGAALENSVSSAVVAKEPGDNAQPEAETESAPAASAESPADAALAEDAPASQEAQAPAKAATAVAPRKVVAVRGDDRPGMKRTEPAGRDERRGPPRDRDARGGTGRASERGNDRGAWTTSRPDRAGRQDGPPRLGDAAFRAQRQALENAQAALRKLAEQAHGEVLTQFMSAWQQRDAAQLPSPQALGSRVSAAGRGGWAAALAAAPTGEAAQALLRLEMAADVPTPAEHQAARRLVQLQLLTRKHQSGPQETWMADVQAVLAAAHDAGAARRLMAVLKALLRR